MSAAIGAASSGLRGPLSTLLQQIVRNRPTVPIGSKIPKTGFGSTPTESPFGALPEEGFLTRWIQGLFAPKTPVRSPSSTPKTSTPKSVPKIDIGTKAAIATTAASTAVFGSSFLFTQTPGGQATTSQAFGAFNDVNRFFSSNPLILLALVGLGILLVVKK